MAVGCARRRQRGRRDRNARRARRPLMLLDANLLFYAVHKRSEQHAAAA
jgi:hypothetical protein